MNGWEIRCCFAAFGLWACDLCHSKLEMLGFSLYNCGDAENVIPLSCCSCYLAVEMFLDNSNSGNCLNFLWLCGCATNYEISGGARNVVYIYLAGEYCLFIQWHNSPVLNV